MIGIKIKDKLHMFDYGSDNNSTLWGHRCKVKAGNFKYDL
jgi:hypothetical protein